MLVFRSFSQWKAHRHLNFLGLVVGTRTLELYLRRPLSLPASEGLPYRPPGAWRICHPDRDCRLDDQANDEEKQAARRGGARVGFALMEPFPSTSMPEASRCCMGGVSRSFYWLCESRYGQPISPTGTDGYRVATMCAYS
jgi:hypothetical protein